MSRISVALGVLMVFVAAAAQAACSSAQTSGMAFGSYNSLSVLPKEATGDITVTCDRFTSYTVKLSPGSSGVFSRRTMGAGAKEVLEYNLYLDTAHRDIWGDGQDRTLVYAASGSGKAQTLTVYGRIPAGQLVHPGTYQDSVTVTLEW